MNLSPLPKLAFLDNNGRPLVGGLLFTYASGTTTKIATYVNATGSPQNTNPIILDYRGECDCWLADGQAYTFVLSPANDTDPPTNPIWSANDINPSSLLAFGNFAPDVGSVDAYKVDDAIEVPGYVNGLFVSVLIANTNTGASTLDYDGLGPKNIQLPNGSPLIGGELVAGGVYLFEYISPNWQLLNSSVASAAILQEGRTAPNPLLDWFTDLFTVTQCQGPGTAQLQEDINDVFDATFAGLVSTNAFYVAPWGNDGNTGASWSQAFLTIAKGLRNTVSMGTLYVWPGTYAPSDARYTDTYADHPKKIVAPYGGVILAFDGDSLAQAVWTPNGTYGNVWQTTLVTTSYPIRVLNSETLDQYGLSTPMPLQGSLGESSASALLRLNDSAYGWWYDTGTQILYVRNGVEDVNAVSKLRLQAVYGPNSGDNIFQLNATITYWENITFWAYAFIQNIAGQATPQGWFKNCQLGYAASNAFTVSGGFCYTQGCRSYRPTADGANYNESNGVVSQGIEIDFQSQLAGDISTFGSAATQPYNPVSTAQNKNGSSNHDSYCVRVNGLYTDCFGPLVADTTSSVNWNLAVRSGYCFVSVGGGTRDGFYASGTSYLDGCSAGPGVDEGIHSDGGVVLTYNTFGTQLATSGGTITAYSPPA